MMFVHAGWFLFALLAFTLGSRLASPVPGDSSAGGAAALTNVRGAPAAAESALRTRARERGDRKPVGRGDGMISKLFASRGLAGGDVLLLAEEVARDPNPITRRLAFTRLLESLTPENALLIREQLVALGI